MSSLSGITSLIVSRGGGGLRGRLGGGGGGIGRRLFFSSLSLSSSSLSSSSSFTILLRGGGAPTIQHHQQQQYRNFAIRRRYANEDYDNEDDDEPLPPLDSIKPPSSWPSTSTTSEDDLPKDPHAYIRKAVTSAYAIDLTSTPPKLSTLDMACIIKDNENNNVVHHGRYGELGNVESILESIPLEYLTMLYPAAQGVAAVRTILSKEEESSSSSSSSLSLSSGSKGTLLIYGASKPCGLSTLQIASSQNVNVVGVVDGQHSGNIELMDSIKLLTNKPYGTAVPEEYALVKQNFKELVYNSVNDNNGNDYDLPVEEVDYYLTEFKQNLLEYIKAYPEGKASVPNDAMKFPLLGKEKDRVNFIDNMEIYLDQYGHGSPSISQSELDSKLSKEIYEVWKRKFSKVMVDNISGVEKESIPNFEPGRVLKELLNASSNAKDELPSYLTKQEVVEGAGDEYIPYEFSILDSKTSSTPVKGTGGGGGGPILGAVIEATPELTKVCNILDKVKSSKREKAEALQFLSNSERQAYAAASSVAKLASDAGKQVLVVGGELPGLQSVKVNNNDVQEALEGMEIDPFTENSKLNYFLQVYRAGDYPIYSNYAIHRALEPCSGPRQIVVTK